MVYDLIRGGTEGQCARVAMELARRGRPQRVAVFRAGGFFAPAVQRQCGPVYQIGIRHMARWQTVQEVWRLRRLLRREHMALLHAWDADAAIFGSLAAGWAGIPFITSRRDLGEIYPRFKLALMTRADRNAQRVVVNARAIQQPLIRQGTPAHKVRLIYNILDLAEFDREAELPFSKAAQLPPDGRLAVMVARLDPEKDVALALAAVARVRMEFPDLHLVVAGDGVEMGRLRQQAAALGVADHAIFLGDVTDVPALLRRGHVGLLTPRANEGLSNSILEYMAAGLPVVATDCGGNAELVAHGRSGFIVPPGRATDLGDALGRLLADGELGAAMGRAGRDMVAQSHDPGRIATQFDSLYQEVVSGARNQADPNRDLPT